jgi:hypothetical protein
MAQKKELKEKLSGREILLSIDFETFAEIKILKEPVDRISQNIA